MSGLKPLSAPVCDDNRVAEESAEASAGGQEHCKTVPFAIKITATIVVAAPLVLR